MHTARLSPGWRLSNYCELHFVVTTHGERATGLSDSAAVSERQVAVNGCKYVAGAALWGLPWQQELI